MNQDADSIEFTGPGFGAKVKGAAWSSKEVIVVIVMIACTAFLYFERTQSNRSFIDQHLLTQKMLASVLQGQSDMVRELRGVVSEMGASNDVQAYILSLPQVQRERLNLSMPPTLRQRIRTNSQ